MKNKEFVAEIIDYTHDGKGIVKYDNYPIFVKDTILNEKIKTKIVKWKKKYGYGRCLEVINASKQRIEPPCPYFKRCGGCQIQFMDYNLQRDFKLRKVKNAFYKQGINLEKISFIDNPQPFNYRNKLSIPLIKEEGIISAGLYQENSNEIIKIETCLIQEDNINDILKIIVELLNQYHLGIYNKNTNKGYLRQIIIRASHANRQVLVGFVVNEKEYSHKLDKVIEQLKQVDIIKSIVINFNTRNDNVILGQDNLVVYGSGFIQDSINDLTFNISLNSFYQVNNLQMDNLYLKAISMAGLSKDDIVFDAYCGVGTISCYLAKQVKKVIGVDIVESAIDNANENKLINNIENVEFYCEDVNDYLEKHRNQFDVVFLDPPRKGCTIDFLKKVIETNPEKIVYIACDPATQARDVKFLNDNNYQIKEVCAVDMFSQTYHVENIVLLEKVI